MANKAVQENEATQKTTSSIDFWRVGCIFIGHLNWEEHDER
ncbi:hypothetical protein [Legionella sp. km535]|nr:hypothetical protein [Legionella sp. km535]